MKRKILFAGVASLLLLSSCSDYLDTNSKSLFQDDYIYASEEEIFSALLNAYTQTMASACLGDRIPMYLTGTGSDIELRPDYGTTGRGEIINCYPNRTTQMMTVVGSEQWNAGYKAINAANEVILGIENYYRGELEKTSPTNLTMMYGEAKLLRALVYYELVRNFGDIPAIFQPYRTGMALSVPATHRWEILDVLLTDLEQVAPLMYWSTEIPQKAERVSRGFCYGMIAKIAMLRGGYSLFPNGSGVMDFGEMKRDEANWQEYYRQAVTALDKLVAGQQHSLITNDTRTSVNGGVNGEFNNPFQLVFQQQMDSQISAESLWEGGLARDNGGNWGYAYNRAHTGANNSNVSKAYGAVRFTPTYYYSFDPADLRRDVTVAVTGTSGAGKEETYSLATFGDGAFNGISLNKWDKMRMANPYNQGNGRAGINYVYMRYSDALLLLAEAHAALNQEGNAKNYLKQVRSRAFLAKDQAIKVDGYVNGLSGVALLDAIKQERKWELGGENIIKHDIVRWNDFSDDIWQARTMLQAAADGIRTNGYYEYANGLQISDSVYVKYCTDNDLRAMGLSSYVGTTYGTPVGAEDNPILSPAWRGVGDAGKFPDPNSILAIKGLNKYLTNAERIELRKQGYEAKAWGVQLVGLAKPYSEYVENNWSGYTTEDRNAGRPARYILPIPGQTIIDSGINPETGELYLVNFYGFSNTP